MPKCKRGLGSDPGWPKDLMSTSFQSATSVVRTETGLCTFGGRDALTCLVTATRLLSVLWVVPSSLGGGIKGRV